MADAKEVISEFRPCVGVEGYEISQSGEVRNKKTGYTLKLGIRNGYPAINIRRKHYLIHRLVALTWLPPPDDPAKTQVNHKNRDKSNSDVSNLEWSTPTENIQHAHKTEPKRRPKQGKAVESVDAEGNTKQYCSLKEACRALGTHHSNIYAAMDKPGRTCKGLRWRSCTPTELPDEEWRDLLYEHFDLTFTCPYSVSSLGRIKGAKGIMNGYVNGEGYIYIHLTTIIDGETTAVLMALHRIIATVFLGPAPSEGMQVDHINKKRSDNACTNLRWVTPQENVIFAIGRPVVQSTKDGTEVATFDSGAQAARAVERAVSSIHQAIKRGGPSAGYYWAYA